MYLEITIWQAYYKKNKFYIISNREHVSQYFKQLS